MAPLFTRRFAAVKPGEYKTAAGLMTGTSMDGIDVLITRIKGVSTSTVHDDVAFESFAFPKKHSAEVRRIIASKSSGLRELCLVNYRLAELYAGAIEKACRNNGLALRDLDFAAISGQTFYHIPKKATMQLGDGSYLCNLIGAPVIWNFRAADIAAGGQGAPLVPYLDYALLSRLKRNVVTLNVGGISNATFIPADGDFSKVAAFDCGPGNMIIDRMASRYTRGAAKYDRDSRIALSGRVVPALMKKMLSHPYLKKSPPKSTGREEFGDDYADYVIEYAISHNVSYPDMIRTATEFTARCAADSIMRFILPLFSRAADGETLLLAAGGGARNPLMMRTLGDILKPYGVRMEKPERYGIDPRSKEALLMVVLGNETIYMNPSNVPSATGAKRPVITGTISIP